MEHDKATKHSRRDAGERRHRHHHHRHHHRGDDREGGKEQRLDRTEQSTDKRAGTHSSHAAQSNADAGDSHTSLELTVAMWESPGVRAATRELFFGNNTRSPLPLHLEDKFDDFVRLYLRRRAATTNRPPPAALPPPAPHTAAGAGAPRSVGNEDSTGSSGGTDESSSFFIDRQPNSRESLSSRGSNRIVALPTGPFDRRFTVNCVLRLGAEGEAPRHAQPRNAAEVRPWRMWSSDLNINTSTLFSQHQ